MKEPPLNRSVSPVEEYVRLVDELNDTHLLNVAMAHITHFDAAILLSEEEMNRRLGISAEDLEGYNNIELD